MLANTRGTAHAAARVHTAPHSARAPTRAACTCARVHTARYVEHVRSLSADKSKIGHRVGEEVSMSPGGYEIAALAAGGSIKLVDAALSGGITNGYALTRCECITRHTCVHAHCALALAFVRACCVHAGSGVVASACMLWWPWCWSCLLHLLHGATTTHAATQAAGAPRRV